MLTTDCPLCSGVATIDAELTAAHCDGCGATVAIAPDPEPATLDAAA